MSLLPRELMELQIGQIDLLMAMYASDDGAISMDDLSRDRLQSLRSWCEDSDHEVPPRDTPPSLSLCLTLTLEGDDGGSSSCARRSLDVEISLPLLYDGPDEPTDPPRASVRVRQPAWLSRAETSLLNESIISSSSSDEDLLSSIEHISAEAGRLSRTPDNTSQHPPPSSSSPLTRTFFYFPSISTRSKRDDIVHYAPTYGLTGFLLAGKPGLLCLEGDTRSIDDYMRFIKTESWGDIPPQHKKVTERYRQSGPAMARAFTDMREITDLFGERRGVRANRNDMKALETWMHDNGVGDAFEEVLI